jgi:integrase
MAFIEKRKRTVKDEHGNPVIGPDGKKVRVVWKDKRGQVRWDARVHVGRDKGGGKAYVYEAFPTKTEAEAWARKLETRRKDNNERVATSKLTLSEWLLEWLHVRGNLNQVRECTLYNQRTALRKWVMEVAPGAPIRLGEVALRKLHVTDFDKLYVHMVEQGMRPRGVEYLHRILHTALNHAVKKELLPRNPASKATLPKEDYAAKGKKKEKFIELEDAEALLRAARELRDTAERPARNYTALWFVLLWGGLRPCEAFGLRWSDIDFDAGTVRVERSLTRTGLDREKHPKGWRLTDPKTKNASRTIPLFSDVKAELALHRTAQKRERLAFGKEYQDEGFVFATATGSPLDLNNVCRGPFRRVMERAGLGEYGPEPKKPISGPTPARPFTPSHPIYSLRHTAGSLWLAAGVDLKVVSEWLGHGSYAFTADTYTGVLQKLSQDSLAKVEAMIAATGTG